MCGLWLDNGMTNATLTSSLTAYHADLVVVAVGADRTPRFAAGFYLAADAAAFAIAYRDRGGRAEVLTRAEFKALEV